MVIVELQGYGDFDICQTQAVYYHPDLHHKKFRVRDLGNFDDDKTPDRLITALEAAGFRRAPTQQITYGGNY